MNKIDETTFVAELISETSMSPVATKLGTHQSTMCLYENEDDAYFIEWDIPALETVETISLWCEEGTRCIYDYDGVFALPVEAIRLLQKNDFDTSLVD
jgi:hypothetical protein